MAFTKKHDHAILISFENRGKRQGARDKGRRAGAESRSGVPPLSERSAVRLARESRRRRSNIYPPFSSLVVFAEHGDSSENRRERRHLAAERSRQGCPHHIFSSRNQKRRTGLSYPHYVSLIALAILKN